MVRCVRSTGTRAWQRRTGRVAIGLLHEANVLHLELAVALDGSLHLVHHVLNKLLGHLLVLHQLHRGVRVQVVLLHLVHLLDDVARRGALGGARADGRGVGALLVGRAGGRVERARGRVVHKVEEADLRAELVAQRRGNEDVGRVLQVVGHRLVRQHGAVIVARLDRLADEIRRSGEDLERVLQTVDVGDVAARGDAGGEEGQGSGQKNRCARTGTASRHTSRRHRASRTAGGSRGWPPRWRRTASRRWPTRRRQR